MKNTWTAYFEIEIVDSKCEPHTFPYEIVLDENETQFTAFKSALIEARYIIETLIPGSWISKIELA